MSERVLARPAGPLVRLKPGRLRNHPWIYRGQVADVAGGVEPGGLVTVVDAAGRFVGRGYYNPRVSLVCRLLTTVDEAIDAAFFAGRIREAIDHRYGLDTEREAYRLVWSEADRLPGLVVDRYGPILVVQCSTFGMRRLVGWIAAGLRAALGEVPIYRLDDAAAAAVEGFDPARGWLDQPGPERLVVREGGCRVIVSPGEGQKTGLYLDQADNRILVARAAAGCDVLDAFCYTGGFAVHALTQGAGRATCLDSSAAALARARENLALNAVADRATLVEANAFEELRRLERGRARFGVIIVDPPPFTRTKTAVEAAVRGYKEVNLRALRLLAPKGVLATFSCSHHVSLARFEEVCREAAEDAGVAVRVLSILGQGRDHPVLLTVPETHYLKGLLLQAL